MSVNITGRQMTLMSAICSRYRPGLRQYATVQTMNDYQGACCALFHALYNGRWQSRQRHARGMTTERSYVLLQTWWTTVYQAWTFEHIVVNIKTKGMGYA